MATLRYGVKPDEFRRTYVNTKISSLVDEFIDSGEKAVEVVFAEGEYCSPTSCQTTIQKNIKTRRITSVKVMQRNGRVFLVRKENDK